MRIALFNLDCLATNQAIRSFLRRHRGEIAFVGLSPPFRRERGGLLRQTAWHMRRSGTDFSNFLGCNFLLPRVAHGLRARLRIARNRPHAIAEECRSAGINVRRIANVNAPDVVDALRSSGVDLIVSCYFDQIFKADVLAVGRLGAINVHSSLLPHHRGPMPVIYSALDRPSTLGVSVHAMEAGIDTGPILIQEPYQPADGESVLESMAVLHDRGLQLVSSLLPAIASGSLAARPQSEGSYESFPSRADIRRLKRQGTPLMTWSDIRRAVGVPIGT